MICALALVLVTLVKVELPVVARMSTRDVAATPQEPELRKVRNVTLTVNSRDYAPVAAQAEKVIDLVADSLDGLGIALPRGARIALDSRAEYEATCRRWGTEVLKSRAIVLAFDKVSGWMPLMSMSAENCEGELMGQLMRDFALSLGELTGISQVQGPSAPVSRFGLRGFCRTAYLCSALHNDGKVVPMVEAPEVQAAILLVANQQPRRTAREILATTPMDQTSQQHTQSFLDILLYEIPAAKRKAVGKAVIAWPRDIGTSPNDKQIARMERDLVEALGIKGSIVKEMQLEKRMTDLGIDRKQQKEPGSLLRAFYDVQIDRTAAACEAAGARRPGEASAGGGK